MSNNNVTGDEGISLANVISVKIGEEYYLFKETKNYKPRVLMIMKINGELKIGKVYLPQKIIILHDDIVVHIQGNMKIEYVGELTHKIVKA